MDSRVPGQDVPGKVAFPTGPVGDHSTGFLDEHGGELTEEEAREALRAVGGSGDRDDQAGS
jgi:hypothetical protein